MVKDTMYKVFIDGGHGTTGLEIGERLLKRDDIQLLEIEERYRKDLAARVEMAGKADVTIMCLPDAASKELAEVLPDDVRVIDTSTAHRVDPGWVYGMAELCPGWREKIRNAARVANPGCHATGFILLARPLVDARLISSKSPLSCFCMTGYSGGGKKMIEDYDRRHKEAAEAVSPSQYALGQCHKHLPEMKIMSGLEKEPVFCPVVGDFYRGMVMTIELPAEMICGYDGTVDSEVVQSSMADSGVVQTPTADPGMVQSSGDIDLTRMDRDCGDNKNDILQIIKDTYRKRYKDEPLIRLADTPEDGFLYSDTMAGSDGFEIMVSGNSDRILLVSRFDNLGKGASGAAVQNLNIMLGTDEWKGLRF
ncbi:MAG: N-acetyl-gamma-glutamyl-phosphate reductase [Eubacterium sp.]|nr:N-acetyl-gamma-glutamyl-phosphate reductase [Eubacterium sp.]